MVDADEWDRAVSIAIANPNTSLHSSPSRIDPFSATGQNKLTFVYCFVLFFFSIALDIDTGKISLYYYCVRVCVLMRCFSSRITCTFVDSLSALFETVFPCHD